LSITDVPNNQQNKACHINKVSNIYNATTTNYYNNDNNYAPKSGRNLENNNYRFRPAI